MQNLLKFTLLTLIFLTTLNANTGEFKIITSSDAEELRLKKTNVEFVSDNVVKVKLSNVSKYYSLNLLNDLYFSTTTNLTQGYYIDLNGFLYRADNDISLNSVCSYSGIGYFWRCDPSFSVGGSNYEIQARKGASYQLNELNTCKPDENLNTQTNQCVKCPEGHSWDAENNMCWQDCTNMIKNKWGFSNGTPQGICIDCSGEKTLLEAADCACRSLGFGGSNFAGRFENHSNYPKCAYDAECKVEKRQIRIYDPSCKEEKEPKPDDNNTNPKDPDTPNPDNPKDPNNPKDPKNPNDPGKDNNDPNNPNPNGPKPDQDSEYCKKNPTDPKCKKKDNNNTNPKGPGGGGPSGDNDNKDKDAKFDPKDFDYNDIEKDVNGFKDTILKHYNDMNSKFDDFKRGYNQLINNIQGKGFSAIKDQSSSSSCPKAFKIDMGHNIVKTVYVDICKELSKLKSTFYYIFYLFFFCFFLFLTIKLTIPLMVNQFKYI